MKRKQVSPEELMKYLKEQDTTIDTIEKVAVEGREVIKIETVQLEEHVIQCKLQNGQYNYDVVSHAPHIEKLIRNYYTSKNCLQPFKGDYIGVDESGKGDYFGPLVAAGFISNEKRDEELIRLGVKDSKKYKDDKIVEIAGKLMETYPDSYCVKLLEPESYNRKISEYKIINKNQKDVLADLHDSVIEILLKNNKVGGIIADAVDLMNRQHYLKFSNHNIIDAIETPRGEDNPAVAAAGIIARYYFLQALEAMSEELHIDISKGASAGAINVAKQLVALNDRKILKKYAKVHFKTTAKVLS